MLAFYLLDARSSGDEALIPIRGRPELHTQVIADHSTGNCNTFKVLYFLLKCLMTLILNQSIAFSMS